MVIRKNDYIHIDGTFVNVDDLHCMFISPARKGISAIYRDGQQIDIKYDNANSCANAWREIVKVFDPEITKNIFVNPHRTIIVRVEGLRYAEFDMIDYRFILQYKDGRTYAYKYTSNKVTYGIYAALLLSLMDYKVTNSHPISVNRTRADFWADPVTTIDGLTLGEEIPNAEYWSIIDKAFVDANRQKKSKKK